MQTHRELPRDRRSYDTRPSRRRNRTFNATGTLLCWIGTLLGWFVLAAAVTRMLMGGSR